MSDKIKRYIDANALQAQLERKKAGIANKRYIEGWNDCMARVKSMVSAAPGVTLGNGGKGYATELVSVKDENICT